MPVLRQFKYKGNRKKLIKCDKDYLTKAIQDIKQRHLF